jgi:hypothetical protein
MDRPAVLEDIHELASSMPGVKRVEGSNGNPIYQVGGKSFVFFRNPRPDAVDPETGERYRDVIAIWVESEEAKQAIVRDESTPFFTTPHFNGYPSVLVRASQLSEMTRRELAEVLAEAWLSRAPKRLAARWLEQHPDWPAGA